ncbi:hypothetical protein Tco_1429866, partial [Tanacetum coccineum]
ILARVGNNAHGAGIGKGTTAAGDLHLLQDGLADNLEEESPANDSNVVGGYMVDNGADLPRRKASLLYEVLAGGG